MFYRGRELRRLWEIEVYDGDPNKKKPKTHTETVIAWNAVDAIRKCGAMKAAKQPVDLGYVMKDKGEAILKIEDTAGPTDEEVTPTIENQEDSF